MTRSLWYDWNVYLCDDETRLKSDSRTTQLLSIRRVLRNPSLSLETGILMTCTSAAPDSESFVTPRSKMCLLCRWETRVEQHTCVTCSLAAPLPWSSTGSASLFHPVVVLDRVDRFLLAVQACTRGSNLRWRLELACQAPSSCVCTYCVVCPLVVLVHPQRPPKSYRVLWCPLGPTGCVFSWSGCHENSALLCCAVVVAWT